MSVQRTKMADQPMQTIPTARAKYGRNPCEILAWALKDMRSYVAPSKLSRDDRVLSVWHGASVFGEGAVPVVGGSVRVWVLLAGWAIDGGGR